MPATLVVRAEVVDITRDTPQSTDAFLVDTCVWFWMTYTRASSAPSRGPKRYQTKQYPSYTKAALSAGSCVTQSGLNFAELAHRIECTEFDIYNALGVNVCSDMKKYRHDLSAERNNVLAEIEAAWAQVTQLSSPLTLTIDSSTAISALACLHSAQVDGYDSLMLECMKTNGVTQIVTDDGDFATVAGIRVFTANWNVISAASRQQKLIVR